MSLTRRSFLERLGAVGGVSAVYLGMEAMGLLNASPASAATFALPPGSGRGRKVVILGAGIAGLVSAYELRRAGWDVTVLEARDRDRRPGVDRSRRRPCRPDRPAGPALRLRRRPLSQCRRGAAPAAAPRHPRLCPPARRADRGHGQFRPRREMGLRRPRLHRPADQVNDVRGRFSELLAKAIDRGALDQEMSRRRPDHAMRQFLAFYGELSESGDYAPDGQSGYAELPGGYNHGRPPG